MDFGPVICRHNITVGTQKFGKPSPGMDPTIGMPHSNSFKENYIIRLETNQINFGETRSHWRMN